MPAARFTTSSLDPQIGIDREAAAQRLHLLAHFLLVLRIAVRMARQPAQHAADEGAHLLELAAAEAARGRRRRAEADAGSHRRLFRIAGNAVLVAGDARPVEALLEIGIASCRERVCQYV